MELSNKIVLQNNLLILYKVVTAFSSSLELWDIDNSAVVVVVVMISRWSL